MRVESITFQRDKNSKAEKGIMVTGTVYNNDVNIVIVDELGEIVPKTHNWDFNHELAVDYDVTRPSFVEYKDTTGEKVEVSRMDCFITSNSNSEENIGYLKLADDFFE